MTPRYRCSVAALGQPMAGSAAHDRAFLLVEHPGPWGRNALAESRWLAPDLRERLAARAEAAGVRIQLIRRPGTAHTEGGFRTFLAYADPAAPWVAGRTLTVPDELDLVPLEGLADGPPEGWTPGTGPLFLVCTNGRRDVCCAEQGRPIAAALAAAYPEGTWETTHIGGHRFAGTMLVLPTGFAYGRLDPDAALEVARATRQGEVVPAYLRGRAAYPPAVQAAEVALLERLGITDPSALTLVGSTTDESGTTVRFAHGGAEHLAHVVADPQPPMRQSCADEVLKPATAWRVT